MPDPAFRALFAATEDVRWDSLHQVSRRARRRSIGRAATVAGIVAAGLVSGGVAVARTTQDPVTPPVATVTPAPSVPPSPAPVLPSLPPSSPPRSTSKPPPPTDITAAMMLRPQDVGSGYTAVASSGGDWTFEFNAAVLGCPRGTRPGPLADRNRTLRKGEPQAETYVNQETTRYAGDEAADYLDEIRDRAASCPEAEIAAQGFAGDESLLVVFDHGGGALAKIVLVRQGDVLTEIYAKPVRSDPASRELGRRAAARF